MASFLSRIGSAVAKAATRITFSGRGAWWNVRSLWSSGGPDYAALVENDGRATAIVSACIQWIQRTFPEAPLRIMRVAGTDGAVGVKPK